MWQRPNPNFVPQGSFGQIACDLRLLCLEERKVFMPHPKTLVRIKVGITRQKIWRRCSKGSLVKSRNNNSTSFREKGGPRLKVEQLLLHHQSQVSASLTVASLNCASLVSAAVMFSGTVLPTMSRSRAFDSSMTPLSD